MAFAAIALGSNMGNRQRQLTSAVIALAELGRVCAVSALHETEPVGYVDQPRFLNGAALLLTELQPLELLRALLKIERAAGRDRSHGIAKGPRTLDLDLLLYDDVVVASTELTLPHPELHRRAFVLQPLAEIAPAMLHPLLHSSVAQLWATYTTRHDEEGLGQEGRGEEER